MIYKLEHEEIYKGYHLMVVFINAFRCGYVGLPKGHKYVGKHYDELDLDVHGGLTFSEHNHRLKKEGYEYYLGFDCAHFDDGADLKYMKENGATLDEMMIYRHMDGEVRTKKYVLSELYNMVHQLEALK